MITLADLIVTQQPAILRIAIDLLEPIEHDLTTPPTTLRTRVGHRLEAAGLHLRRTMEEVSLVDDGRDIDNQQQQARLLG